MPRRTLFLRAGTVSLLAGIAVWSGYLIEQRRSGQEEASRLLAAFSNQDDISEQQATAEAAAQVELLRASGYVRRLFLRTALQDGADARRLRGREQAFEVSLSQVKSSEARALFEQAILPAVSVSSDPDVLREGFALMERWGISSARSSTENDHFALTLSVALLHTQDADKLGALASGLGVLGPRLSSPWANNLATQISDAATQAHDTGALAALAFAASSVEVNIDSKKADEIASKIVGRMTMEARSNALESLEVLIEPLRDKISAGKAAELASQLAPRLILEQIGPGLDAFLAAWRVVAAKVRPEQAAPLAALLTQRMGMPAGAHLLNRLAVALAALDAKQTFEQAGAILISRMRAERDPKALAELGSAAGILGKKAGEESAGILFKRLVAERDPGAMAALAGALMELAGTTEPGAKGLSGSLPRSQSRPGPVPASEQLDAAIDSAELRSAGPKFTAAMATETDSDALKSLTAALLALKDEAGAENLDKAASILAARIGLEKDFASLHDLAASLAALKGQVEPGALESAASSIGARMIAAKDAVTIDGLGRSFALIAPLLDETGAAQIGAQLTERAASEPQANILRAYGEAMGSLPVGSLNADQLAKLGRMFDIPNAPCQVVTRVSSSDTAPLVRQILNPLCFEDGWVATVAALGTATKQDLVKRSDDASNRPLLTDDDDEATSEPTGPEGVVDFNKLSQTLDGLRPSEAFDAWLPVAGVILLGTGALLLLLSWPRIHANKQE